ncbi:hypothetical protein KY360_02445 [Candidatus Woesearchaeota archaeon]|nr:hypothetical protein [Candidatus Woesearchaeota archaeon]
MKGIREKLLSIAIAIILTMFIFYGINTFYPRPEWDDMCKDVGAATNQTACEAAKGEWSYNEGRPRPVKLEGEEIYEPGFCECKVFEDAREGYSRVVFIVALILGLIAVLLGAIVLKLPSVASGVMAGGIITVIFGTLEYWGHMPDFARFICLGIVLAILITIAYKKLSKK